MDWYLIQYGLMILLGLFLGAKDLFNRSVNFKDGLLFLLVALTMFNYMSFLLLIGSFAIVKLLLKSQIKITVSDQYLAYASSINLATFLVMIVTILEGWVISKLKLVTKPPVWTLYMINLIIMVVALTAYNFYIL